MQIITMKARAMTNRSGQPLSLSRLDCRSPLRLNSTGLTCCAELFCRVQVISSKKTKSDMWETVSLKPCRWFAYIPVLSLCVAKFIALLPSWLAALFVGFLTLTTFFCQFFILSILSPQNWTYREGMSPLTFHFFSPLLNVALNGAL